MSSSTSQSHCASLAGLGLPLAPKETTKLLPAADFLAEKTVTEFPGEALDGHLHQPRTTSLSGTPLDLPRAV